VGKALNYEVLKTGSQVGTYIGLSASSFLTWINLHFKTAEEPVVLSPAVGGETHYRIRMQARNGNFIQCLDVKLESGKGWCYRTQVGNTDWLGFRGIEKENVGDCAFKQQ